MKLSFKVLLHLEWNGYFRMHFGTARVVFITQKILNKNFQEQRGDTSNENSESQKHKIDQR